MVEGLQAVRVHITEVNQADLDLDLYVSWLQNVQDNRFIEAVRKDYSKFDLQKYLDARVNNPEVKFWGIFLESNKFIGTIKLEPINWEDQTAWLGMMIGDSSEHGKGYGSQALNLVLDQAENVLLLKEIYLGVHKNNAPAIRIYKKSGFEIYTINNSQITMKKNLTRLADLE
jgi:RimJ/RimL family protein N-acetyltransferase